MDPSRFEWDPEKARVNEKKHGVSFEEAETSFSDEEGLLLDDPDHSETEERFILPRPELQASPARGGSFRAQR